VNAPVKRLILFAREPVRGLVKTRLAREIGPGAAASLYEAFLSDLAVSLTAPDRWEAVLAHAELEAGPFLRKTFPEPWSIVPQGDGCLGERLFHAFGRARGRDGDDVLVAGSDAPTLSRANVDAAFRALTEGADVVFAPAPDGGFSLVGRRGDSGAGDFFESVRWSTAHALEDCRSAAEVRGLRVRLVEEISDVDTSADLEALEAALAADPALAPATRRALVALFGRSAG
jgi:rSAM/selenodomain-associated transferase 1